jgi:hypothetical protein
MAITALLTELLKESDIEIQKKKHRPIWWNTSCEIAFQRLKEVLISD